VHQNLLLMQINAAIEIYFDFISMACGYPVRGALGHFAVYVRRSPRAFATVLLTGILRDSMALTLARSILRRLAQAD
jgi:hypothetical protein